MNYIDYLNNEKVINAYKKIDGINDFHFNHGLKHVKNVCEIMNIIGDVKGKVCIVFDDMIDTAGTICEASKLLIKEGAEDVYVCAAHGIFSGPALVRLEQSPIKEVIVTNTIPREKLCLPDKIRELSVAPLLGEAISRIHSDESVSSLFGFEKVYKA